MKVNLLTLILSFITTYSFGQISYEKGYFIDNDSRRTECLIKNGDWKNNPYEFTYMQTDSGKPKLGTIASVKEFGIYGVSKFIRANIKIDRSGNDVNNMTNDRNPIWSQEKLFLKVIIEGKASLYSYESYNILRYFYTASDTSINQLVYKRYLHDNSDSNNNLTGYSVENNNLFQQQLWTEVKCATTKMSSVENISYTLKDLRNYFIAYNKCLGDTIKDNNHKVKRLFYNLKLTAGGNLISIDLSNKLITPSDLNFKENTSVTFGIESELVLPYNSNKWSITLGPTYQYFNATTERIGKINTIQFSSIEFPLGLRYYLFINKELTIFLNGYYISNYSFNFNSKVEVDNYTTLDIEPRNSYAFGGGIEYRRLSFEIRYYTNRSILSDYIFWTSEYYRSSFIIGYKIVKTKR